MKRKRRFDFEKITRFFIFRNKLLDFFLFILSLITSVLFLVLARVRIFTMFLDTITIETSVLLNDSENLFFSTNEIDLFAHSHSVSVFMYLTALLILLVYFVGRHSPRKTAIIFLYLAIRTPIHLLGTASVLKFNLMGFWSSFVTVETLSSFNVIYSQTYLNLLITAICFLILQGLTLFLIPKSFFVSDKKSILPLNSKSNLCLKNLIMSIPVTLFVVGEGNLLIIYPIYLLKEGANYQPTLSALYTLICSFVILLLLFLFNKIREPIQHVNEENSDKRKLLPIYVFISIILWLFFFFYASLFLIEGYINFTVLWRLFYVIIIPFAISYTVFFLIRYFIKRAKIGKKSKFIKISKTKTLQFVYVFLLLTILCSSIFTINLFVKINNFFSLERKFGLDMKVDRENTVNNAIIYENGSFHMTLEIMVNFTNVPIETQGSLIIFDAFVIDTNNNSFFDSYYYFYNSSITNISVVGTTNIASHQGRDSVGINGMGVCEFQGYINGTFSTGEQIKFMLANYYREDKFSILFTPYSTTIL